jgi:hypothetical protein
MNVTATLVTTLVPTMWVPSPVDAMKDTDSKEVQHVQTLMNVQRTTPVIRCVKIQLDPSHVAVVLAMSWVKMI